MGTDIRYVAERPDQNVGNGAVMAFDELVNICQQFGIQSLQPQLDACSEVLGDSDTVDVAVVGRFKAGKSSFLNTIIGADVMPVWHFQGHVSTSDK